MTPCPRASIARSLHFPGWLAAAFVFLGAPLSYAQQPTDSAIAQQVADDVCDHQVVLLGELPSHGEAQAFQIKAEIAERLMGQCGFDVLLFEAGIYDFLGLEEALSEGRATLRQLNQAIGRFWWTEGLADWRHRLFEQAASGHLTLGGIDDQPSVTSDYARAALPPLVGEAVPADLAASCRAAIDRNLHWRYGEEHQFDEAEQVLLGRCARQAASATSTDPAATDTLPTPRQVMLGNVASYYSRQFNDAPDRDAVMHGNIRWHLARRPETSKVIVWTATVHAARQQGARSYAPFGTHLGAEWGDRLAAVGFTAYAGASSRAGMPSKALEAPPPGSLEAIATADGVALVYLDASALRSLGVVPSRLYGRLSSNDWARYFDGVVVVREEKPPIFEAWE